MTRAPDLLREMVRAFARKMMDPDVEAAYGLGYGEVSPNRVNSRNGPGPGMRHPGRHRRLGGPETPARVVLPLLAFLRALAARGRPFRTIFEQPGAASVRGQHAQAISAPGGLGRRAAPWDRKYSPPAAKPPRETDADVTSDAGLTVVAIPA